MVDLGKRSTAAANGALVGEAGRLWAMRVCLFLAAVITASIIAWQIVIHLPRELDVSTDIIGYPTFANFSYAPYFQTYFLIVAALPAMALAIYAVGARVLQVSNRNQLRLAPLEAQSFPTPSVGAATLGYALIVGAAFGVEIAIAIVPQVHSFWSVALGTMTLYAALACGLGWLGVRFWSMKFDSLVSKFVALTAPLTLLGLYVLSRISSVTIVSTQSVVRYPWLPWWLAVISTLVVIGLVVRSLLRSHEDRGSARIARSMALYLGAPLLLLLTLAQLAPALPSMDMFHEGESLVAARLSLDGALPWRDLISIHGLLEDVFRSMVGMLVFENSRWGANAGRMMLIVPAYWYLNYLLMVRLFQRNWIAIAAVVIMTAAGNQVAEGLFFQTHIRMLLLPIVLLLFARVLDRATWLRTAALTGVALVAFILTPEMAYLVAALGLTLVAFEWLHRIEGDRWWKTFRRVALCSACGAVGLSIFLCYLVATGSLNAYIGYFQTFAFGHQLTGSIPILWQYWAFDFAAYVTVGVVLVAFWYVIANLRARRTMSANDWTMVALAIFVALYYQKFLSRADGHVFQSWAVAIPLFYYEVYKLVSWASERLAARTWKPPFSSRFVVQLPFVSLFLIVLVIAASPLATQAETGSARFRMFVPEPAQMAREGYVISGQSAVAGVTEVKQVLDAVMQPGDKLYDFTNEPGLFYFLLNYDPPTRFYHASMAIRQRNQNELIDELRKSDPDIVVYDGNKYGLPEWDGIPNAVRHYDISRYLLNHYEPFIAFDGYTFLAKKGKVIPRAELEKLALAQPVFEDLYFIAHSCAWGYSPNFFSLTPSPNAKRSEPLVGAVDAAFPRRVRYQLPPDAQQYGWIELESSKPFVNDSFVLSDGSDYYREDDPTHSIRFQTLPRSGKRYRAKLSNCAQWRGFAGGSVVLSHGAEQGDLAVRLVR